MFSSTSPSILFHLLLALTVFSSCHADGTSDQHETQKYTEGAPHVTLKRSTFETHNEFPQAMASVCLIANSKIEIQTNTTAKELVAKNEDDTQEFSSNWPLPDVFPIEVTGKPAGKMVKFEFHVSHNSKAVARSTNSFERQDIVMDSKNGYAAPATSKITFIEDRSNCLEKPLYYFESEYLFSLASKNSHYIVRVSADVCRFSWEYKRDMAYYIGNDNEWQKNFLFGTEQSLHKPRFRVFPDPGNEILITMEENPTLDIEVDFFHAFEFTVGVLLWDWVENKYVIDDVRLDQPIIEENLKQDSNESLYRERLLKIELIGISFNKSLAKNRYGREMQRNDTVVKIRITVNFGSRFMSGKLVLGYHWRETRWHALRVIRGISTERIISMKLAQNLSIHPSYAVKAVGAELECDEKGNRGRKKFGKNCVVECQAYGPDISAIFILKSHPFKLPLRSMSYNSQGIAYVMEDVGPASEHNAGRYQCIATTNTGTFSTSDIILHTSGFTKVINLTVEDLGNSTTRIVCSATGEQPLNFSITVSDNRGNLLERVDNLIGNLPMIESSENETNLILLICSDQIEYPRTMIVCNATGNRGADSKTIYLPYTDKQSCDPLLPKLIPDKSSISKIRRFGDEGVRVVCRASGKDLDIMVTYGGRGEYYRVDKNHGNFGIPRYSQNDEWFEKDVHIPVNKVKHPWSTLHCGAKNKYGIDWMDFDLNDLDI